MTRHPDKNKDAGAEERFVELAKAYEILSDEKLREDYDIYLNWILEGAPFPPPDHSNYYQDKMRNHRWAQFYEYGAQVIFGTEHSIWTVLAWLTAGITVLQWGAYYSVHVSYRRKVQYTKQFRDALKQNHAAIQEDATFDMAAVEAKLEADGVPPFAKKRRQAYVESAKRKFESDLLEEARAQTLDAVKFSNWGKKPSWEDLWICYPATLILKLWRAGKERKRLQNGDDIDGESDNDTEETSTSTSTPSATYKDEGNSSSDPSSQSKYRKSHKKAHGKAFRK